MAEKATAPEAAPRLSVRSHTRHSKPKSTIADLRALAAARGFKVERAMTGADRWRILDVRGLEASDPKARNRVFSIDEGVSYLENLRGIARHPVWRRF